MSLHFTQLYGSNETTFRPLWNFSDIYKFITYLQKIHRGSMCHSEIQRGNNISSCCLFKILLSTGTTIHFLNPSLFFSPFIIQWLEHFQTVVFVDNMIQFNRQRYNGDVYLYCSIYLIATMEFCKLFLSPLQCVIYAISTACIFPSRILLYYMKHNKNVLYIKIFCFDNNKKGSHIVLNIQL